MGIISHTCIIKEGDTYMALYSATLTADNNPYTGCIDVKIRKGGSLGANIAYLKLYRKETNYSGSFELLYKKPISAIEDLDIDITDITVKSGCNYMYSLDLLTGEEASASIKENGSATSSCWFDGLFVGDFDVQHMAQLNCSTSHDRKTEVNYITTLASRTPYRVSNSNVNYTTGKSSGLFLELDQYNNLISGDNCNYTNRIVDYLSDGNEKVLKTSDGGMWYVTIDDDISVDFDDYYKGMRSVSFDWTEIGDVPILRTV